MRDIPARTGKQGDGARQLIERAQRILAFEQRSGHQDTAVKPGGIEAFIERWAAQMLDARNRGEIAAPPAGASGRLPEVAILHLLTGYRALDPMQRAAKIRAALALLDAFETAEPPQAPGAPGNLATESLVAHLEASGWRTGVDHAALEAAARPIVAALRGTAA